MPTIPVILDVDTGVDDALAILFAVKHPDIDVLAHHLCRRQRLARAGRRQHAADSGCRRRTRDPRRRRRAAPADRAGALRLARARRRRPRRHPAAADRPRRAEEAVSAVELMRRTSWTHDVPGDPRGPRPADQPRPAAAHPPRGRRARAHRVHGRLGVRRQRDGRRRVQRLARPRGCGHRARLRRPDVHVRPRRVQPGRGRAGCRERPRRRRRPVGTHRRRRCSATASRSARTRRPSTPDSSATPARCAPWSSRRRSASRVARCASSSPATAAARRSSTCASTRARTSLHGLAEEWANVDVALDVDADRIARLFLTTLGPGEVADGRS